MNHVISIISEEEDKIQGIKYWVIRNSWGREWGYDGFYFVESEKNLLGVESYCMAPYVQFEDFK